MSLILKIASFFNLSRMFIGIVCGALFWVIIFLVAITVNAGVSEKIESCNVTKVIYEESLVATIVCPSNTSNYQNPTAAVFNAWKTNKPLVCTFRTYDFMGTNSRLCKLPIKEKAK